MRALRRVYDALAARPELDAQLVGAIHDELILEAPADERAEAAAELLQAEMRAACSRSFRRRLRWAPTASRRRRSARAGRTSHDHVTATRADDGGIRLTI